LPIFPLFRRPVSNVSLFPSAAWQYGRKWVGKRLFFPFWNVPQSEEVSGFFFFSANLKTVPLPPSGFFPRLKFGKRPSFPPFFASDYGTETKTGPPFLFPCCSKRSWWVPSQFSFLAFHGERIATLLPLSLLSIGRPDFTCTCELVDGFLVFSFSFSPRRQILIRDCSRGRSDKASSLYLLASSWMISY